MCDKCTEKFELKNTLSYVFSIFSLIFFIVISQQNIRIYSAYKNKADRTYQVIFLQFSSSEWQKLPIFFARNTA